MSEQAIVVENLWRTYISTRGLWRTTRVRRDALRGVSVQVAPGELFGLLGPNGAGKTTLVKILSTILLPTSGQASICGYDLCRQVHQVRQRIGIVFGGERGFHPRLTARQNLHYWAALYHLERSQACWRIAELLELVGLTQRADERMENFSRGMKQRLHLARGLLHQPQVLFLDEPSLGLDPVAALAMRTLIKDLQSQGMTIFLTTHSMQEAEALCDRVAFLKDGEIIILDSPQMISRTAALCREVEVTIAAGKDEILGVVQQQSLVRSLSLEETGALCTLHLQLVREDALPALLGLLAGLPVTHVVTREPGLEDVYLQLLGDRKMAVSG